MVSRLIGDHGNSGEAGREQGCCRTARVHGAPARDRGGGPAPYRGLREGSAPDRAALLPGCRTRRGGTYPHPGHRRPDSRTDPGDCRHGDIPGTAGPAGNHPRVGRRTARRCRGGPPDPAHPLQEARHPVPRRPGAGGKRPPAPGAPGVRREEGGGDQEGYQAVPPEAEPDDPPTG